VINVLRSRRGWQRGVRLPSLIGVAFDEAQVIAGCLTSKVGKQYTPETSIGDPALGGALGGYSNRVILSCPLGQRCPGRISI